MLEAIRTYAPRLAYVMPGMHNPGGWVMRESIRRDLARIVDAHETYLIEDEILADTRFGGSVLPSIAAHTRSQRVITLGSVSKIVWGGLRVGWMRGPVGLIDRVARLKAATDYGTSVQAQLSASAALSRLDGPGGIAALRRERLCAQASALTGELTRRLPTWTWLRPEGGISLWVRLPQGDADSFNQVAVRHGVDFTPGSVHTADGTQLDQLRLSYGHPPDVLG